MNKLHRSIAGVGFSPQGTSLGKLYKETNLPRHQNHNLGLTGMIKRKERTSMFDTRSTAGAAREVSGTTVNCLRASTPDFLSGFTPLAVTKPMVTTRQWRY